MAYTVKKLAELSGASVRALRFYDEMGLLPPAYVGENGYRYYEEEQLLRLQQILFYRELGFPLAEVQPLLAAPGFDKVAALEAHKGVLANDLERTRRLIQTIDRTIAKLKGGTPMADKDLYAGFDPKKQDEYERLLFERYGEGAKDHIADSKRRMASRSQADQERLGRESEAILKGLVAELTKGAPVEAAGVQALVARHYDWVSSYWTPNRESYTGLGRLYVEHPDFRKFYEPYHPRLADFLAAAMAAYADAELD